MTIEVSVYYNRSLCSIDDARCLPPEESSSICKHDLAHKKKTMYFSTVLSLLSVACHCPGYMKMSSRIVIVKRCSVGTNDVI